MSGWRRFWTHTADGHNIYGSGKKFRCEPKQADSAHVSRCLNSFGSVEISATALAYAIGHARDDTTRQYVMQSEHDKGHRDSLLRQIYRTEQELASKSLWHALTWRAELRFTPWQVHLSEL